MYILIHNVQESLHASEKFKLFLCYIDIYFCKNF